VAATEVKFCLKPFEHMEIVPNGNVHLCCPQWMPTPAGHVDDEDAWNGEGANEIRNSIIDGSFRFCTGCPWLADATGPVHVLKKTIKLPVMLPRIPVLNLAYDKTCNLACPSCRTEHIVASDIERRHLARVQTRVIELLPRVDQLYVTGSGDPFASATYRELLRSIDPAKYPRLAVKLHTNGLLFTKENWQALGPIRERVREVEVSVDAACAETYAVNRRGDWTTLCANLAFIAGLRPVLRLQLSFVVQQNNWTEMHAFLLLASIVNATHVYFMGINDWKTFSPEEYRQRAVHLPGHPDHNAFKAMLRDPMFHQAGVSLGNLV